MTERPGFFKLAEHESFDAAVTAANQWIKESGVKVLNVEPVVLPNIWSHFEDGTTDGSLGLSVGSQSHWHQFLRVWYEEA